MYKLRVTQGPIEVMQLDLADLDSVAAASRKLEAEPRLDILVLNAGVMACPHSWTKDGFEMQIGTNHFGASVLLPSASLVGPRALKKSLCWDAGHRILLMWQASMSSSFFYNPADEPSCMANFKACWHAQRSTTL